MRRLPRLQPVHVLQGLGAAGALPLLCSLFDVHGLLSLPWITRTDFVPPLHRKRRLLRELVSRTQRGAFELHVLLRLRRIEPQGFSHPERAVRQERLLCDREAPRTRAASLASPHARRRSRSALEAGRRQLGRRQTTCCISRALPPNEPACRSCGALSRDDRRPRARHGSPEAPRRCGDSGAGGARIDAHGAGRPARTDGRHLAVFVVRGVGVLARRLSLSRAMSPAWVRNPGISVTYGVLHAAASIVTNRQRILGGGHSSAHENVGALKSRATREEMS